MNRSLTILLCAAVVWAGGLGETAEGGLKLQESRQTEVSGGTRPAIPKIASDYVLIYKPQPDVYTGKDTKNYKAGQRFGLVREISSVSRFSSTQDESKRSMRNTA